MILPNTKIICPGCKTHIAITKGVIELSDEGHLCRTDFKWPKGAKKLEGGFCADCGEHWSDTSGRLHTEHGWEDI